MKKLQSLTLKEWLVLIITVLTAGVLAVPLIVTSTPGLTTFFPFLFAKALAMQTLIQIMFVVWVFLFTLDRSYRPHLRTPLVMAVHFFFGLLTLSQLFSQDLPRSFWSTMDSMNGLWQHLHYWALFCVLSSTFKTRFDWIKLFLISIGISIIVAGFTLTEWVTTGFHRADGLFGNSLHLSPYALMHVFFAMALLSAKKLPIRILVILGLILNTLSLLAAGSRSSLGAAVIGTLACLAIVAARHKNVRKKIIAGMAGVVLAVVASVFILGSVPSVSRLSSLSAQDRFDLWHIAEQAISQKPLTGWGLNNFSIPLRSLYDPSFHTGLLQGWYEDAHNYYLDLAVGAGIITLFAWFVVLAISSKNLLHIITKKKKTTLFYAALLGALVSQILQDLFMFHSMYQSVMLTFLLAGITILTVEKKPKDHATPFVKDPMIRGSIVGLTALAVAFSIYAYQFLPMKQDVMLVNAMEEITKPDYANLHEIYTEAKSLDSPYTKDELVFLSTGIITSLYNYHLDESEVQAFTNEYARDLATFAVQRPLDYKLIISSIYLAGADAAFKEIIPEESYAASDHALELAPHLAASHRARLAVALHHGDYELAESILPIVESYLTSDYDRAQHQFNTAAVRYGMGDYDAGTEALSYALDHGYVIFSDTVVLEALAHISETHPDIPNAPANYAFEFVRRNQRAFVFETAATLFHNTSLEEPAAQALELLREVDADRAEALETLFESPEVTL